MGPVDGGGVFDAGDASRTENDCSRGEATVAVGLEKDSIKSVVDDGRGTGCSSVGETLTVGLVKDDCTRDVVDRRTSGTKAGCSIVGLVKEDCDRGVFDGAASGTET